MAACPTSFAHHLEVSLFITCISFPQSLSLSLYPWKYFADLQFSFSNLISPHSGHPLIVTTKDFTHLSLSAVLYFLRANFPLSWPLAKLYLFHLSFLYLSVQLPTLTHLYFLIHISLTTLLSCYLLSNHYICTLLTLSDTVSFFPVSPFIFLSFRS